jgi:hypothetical protein
MSWQGLEFRFKHGQVRFGNFLGTAGIALPSMYKSRRRSHRVAFAAQGPRPVLLNGSRRRPGCARAGTNYLGSEDCRALESSRTANRAR